MVQNGNAVVGNNIPLDDIKQQIRCLINNVYDLQKLRIAAGNRLVQSFYIQLGVKPQEKQDDLDKKSKDFLDRIKKEFSMITDVASQMVESDAHGSISTTWVKRAIKSLNSGQVEDQKLEIIRNETDYRLTESYLMMVQSEELATKTLDKIVKTHPMWDAFFKDVKGCGTLMAAVCIAYFDPYKARHASSFLRYCGLDTVQDVDKELGLPVWLEKINGQVTRRKVVQKLAYEDMDGNDYTGAVTRTGEFDDAGIQILKGKDGQLLKEFAVVEKIGDEEVQVYTEIETGDDYIGDVVVSEHARRKGDTELFEYVNKEGQTAYKRGITYNPDLRCKLMGVLSGCILKAGGGSANCNSHYAKIYYDYRARLDNRSNTKDFTAGHKNMMSLRYMMKFFVRDMWATWRELEGLPITEPYEVAKLGNMPHKFNAYHYGKAVGYTNGTP